MFGFLTLARRNESGPLASVVEADRFWRLLPRNDPLSAQQSASEVLADFVLQKDPSKEQLRALLVLDQRSRTLIDALLVNYQTRSAPGKPFERRYWRSALELSRSLAAALEHSLQAMRNDARARSWREYAPAVVLRIFRHRQVEVLLRPFLNDAPIPETWAHLHSIYQFVDAQGWSHVPISEAGDGRPDAPPSTLQKEYISILLLELMNGGQFSPYDAFWLSRWVPHWKQVASLQANMVDSGGESRHLVVDLDSAEGLKRLSAGAMGHALYLEITPILALIDAEIASLRDSLDTMRIPASFGSARQVKLLRKVAANYSPRPPRVDRRGERKPAASTIKAVIGLGNIIRMLRHEERKKLQAASAPVPEVEEITITVDGGYTQSAGQSVDTEVSRAIPSAFEFGAPHHVWQLKDRSASGCRLRAPISDAPRVLPGTLVAIRDDESMRWSLVVVRRLKTRIGDRVDFGVECIGQNPRGVTMALEVPEIAGDLRTKKGASAYFSALYLRESAKQPTMPFKTLIMAAPASGSIRCLKLRSATAEYTVRLKEPIEEQDDFVWLPYEVLDRRALDHRAQSMEVETQTPFRVPAKVQPFPGDGAPTDWLIPQVHKRAESAA